MFVNLTTAALWFAMFGIAAVSGALLVVLVVTWRLLSSDTKEFWKGVIVPLMGPVAVLALTFPIQQGADLQRQAFETAKETQRQAFETAASNQRKTFETFLSDYQGAREDGQKKAEVMRDFVVTRNRPDVAFFTAVGLRLTIHLRRYESIRAEASKNKLTDQALSKYLDEKGAFEERALYFFAGMYRASLVDFYATQGYVLYPRIWMEESFDTIANSIVTQLMGGSEDSISVSAEEQAAIYKFFGTLKATYHSKRDPDKETAPENPNSAAPKRGFAKEVGQDLFEFNLLFSEQREYKDPYFAKCIETLKDGFGRFRARLREGKIRAQDVILACETLVGIDDYAFNTLFSSWYQQFEGPVPVVLKEVRKAPAHFLPFPIQNFEGTKESWEAEREKAWNLILSSIPESLGGVPKRP